MLFASSSIQRRPLPVYTILDMVETAENVWSDSSVYSMTDKDLAGELGDDGRLGLLYKVCFLGGQLVRPM